MRAILLACLVFAAPAAAQDTARVAVAWTLGLRGHALGWDYAADRPAPGGLARAATLLDSLRRAHPDRLVVADGGDLLAGSPFTAWLAREPRTPDPLVEALGIAGYDVAVAGPRDAALGAERLAATYAEARFPTASASLARGDTLALRPFAIVRRGPLRVAVTSVVTGVASPTGSLRARPLDAALPVLEQMRREADVVVVFAHLAPADTARLATLRTLADVVVPAATGSPDVLGLVELSAARSGGRWTVRASAPRTIALDGVAEQPRVATSLAEAHAAARAGLAAPVGRTAGAFSARMARAEPVPLLELLHRVIRRHARTTLSLVVAPPAGTGLPEGELRRRHLQALDPRESPVRSVRVTGEQLTALLEMSGSYYAQDAQGRLALPRNPTGDWFVTVSGASYQLDLSRPAGKRVRELTVGGRYVIPTDTFSLAVLAADAAALPPLRDAPVLAQGEVPLRELLLQEVEREEVLDPARYAASGWRIVPESYADDVRRLWRSAPEAGVRAARADSVALRILSLNDVHGALEGQRQPDGTLLGGVAVIDAHMDSLAARCRCATLRLDAGDALQGTLLSMADHGRTMLEAYRRLGIAAAAVGNHELDWGQDTLRARIAESSFPWLVANLVDSATGRRVPWARSHAIVRVGDLKVGIVGYVTRTVKRAVRAGNTTGLAVTVGATAIRDVLDSVRAQRPDIVVLLAHEGGACEGTSCRGEIFELAEQLGKGAVDVIVSGHSHTVIADEAGAIPIVQAGSNGRSIGVADVLRRPEGGYRVAVRVVRADAAEVTPDAALTTLVEQVAKKQAALADRPIGRLRVAMRRDRGTDHALGNFIADAHRIAARADVALMNRGGVRADLEAGLVTYGELFAVSPFANRIVVLELTGAELRGLLERAAEEGFPGGYFYSGVTLRYDPRRPRGERLVEVRLAEGKKLEDKRRYTLAVNDFVAANRETALRLWERPQRDAGVTDLEALERWFRRLPQPVNPPDTGRLRIEP